MNMPKPNIEAIYQLSPTQQGMLFHHRFAPESSVYFEHMSCVLSGVLNIPVFERAWEKVIDKHAALRTAFVWEELDEPLQVVGGRVEFHVDQRDWREFSSTNSNSN